MGICILAGLKRLWFGRCVFGRRSLVIQQSDEAVVLASVPCSNLNPWYEIPANGIYCLQLNPDALDLQALPRGFTCYPWVNRGNQSTPISESCPDVVSLDQKSSLFAYAWQSEVTIWQSGLQPTLASCGILVPFEPLNKMLPVECDLQNSDSNTSSTNSEADGITGTVSQSPASENETLNRVANLSIHSTGVLRDNLENADTNNTRPQQSSTMTTNCNTSHFPHVQNVAHKETYTQGDVVDPSIKPESTSGDATQLSMCTLSKDIRSDSHDIRKATHHKNVKMVTQNVSEDTNISSDVELHDNCSQDTVASDSRMQKRECNKTNVTPSNSPIDTTQRDLLLRHVTDDHERAAVQLLRALESAVRVRVERQANLCHNCIQNRLKVQKSTAESVIRARHVDRSSGGTYQQKDNENRKGVTVDETVIDPHECRGISQTLDLDDAVNKSGLSFTKQENLDDIHTCCGKTQQENGARLEEDRHKASFDRQQEMEALPLLLDGCKGERCGHARVAVLFSGGIDSLVITALADRVVPADEPIDLLNVAFEQKTRKQSRCSPGFSNFDVPDRLTGREGLAQLSTSRRWNFVEINVTIDELQRTREERVRGLVRPLETVLDDSIGCAVWFAARGQGLLDGHTKYTSTARVLLVGMGADEQLAGYSRHRVKFSCEGWAGLVREIDMEIARISSRNLGRDDRVISDHAREARFPFLDEHVVSLLNSLPIWIKTDLRLPRGVGDKILLRLAAWRLGLTRACVLPKRAIQFGSRIAKCENSKEKGSDKCKRL